ncbi:hypothetical protein TNCV_3926391 [Trichonephila clavipes]|nr:hypothetical protein TNCV_3926391 [Trichonephila clavipes]
MCQLRCHPFHLTVVQNYEVIVHRLRVALECDVNQNIQNTPAAKKCPDRGMGFAVPRINSKQVPREVVLGHHRATTSAQDCYLALRARRHRRTKAPQLARDFTAVSGKRISRKTVYSRLSETGIYYQILWLSNIVELKTSVVDTTGKGACSLFKMNQAKLFQSSLHLERKWSSLSPLLCYKNRQI